MEQRTFNISLPTSNYLKNTIFWSVIDGIIIILAYSLAFFARGRSVQLDQTQAVNFLPIVFLVMLSLMYTSGVYRRIWSQTSGYDIVVIFKAVLFSTGILMIVDIAFGAERPVPLSVIIVANIFAFGGFVSARYRSRLISGFSWRWKAFWDAEALPATTRTLIVGAGESGQTLVWQLKHRWDKSTGYDIIGFIDDDPKKRSMYVEGCPVLGVCSELPKIVKTHNIELVVLAVHNVSGAKFRELLNYCEQTQARIKVISDNRALLSSAQTAPLLRNIQVEDLLGRKPISRSEDVNFDPVLGRTILVTGAAGSIGSEISRQLLSYQPTQLILLDTNESDLHDLVTEMLASPSPTTVIPVLADITNREALEQVFVQYKPEVVFHAAAYKHVPMMELYPKEAIRVNIGGTRMLATLAQAYRVQRFVLVSTDKAVNPMSIMGASKRICELLMHALAQNENNATIFTSVRFGNVLGSRGSVIPTFTRQIKQGGPITVTDKEMSRYFMSIPEAANLVIHAGCMTKGDDLFMLRMGEEIRVVELAERIIRMHGLRPYQDIEIKFTGVRPGEKLHEQLYSESEDPIETIHPGIIKLVEDKSDFDPALFLASLNKLAITPLRDRAEVLVELRHIVTGGYWRTEANAEYMDKAVHNLS